MRRSVQRCHAGERHGERCAALKNEPTGAGPSPGFRGVEAPLKRARKARWDVVVLLVVRIDRRIARSGKRGKEWRVWSGRSSSDIICGVSSVGNRDELIVEPSDHRWIK